MPNEADRFGAPQFFLYTISASEGKLPHIELVRIGSRGRRRFGEHLACLGGVQYTLASILSEYSTLRFTSKMILILSTSSRGLGANYFILFSRSVPILVDSASFLVHHAYWLIS